MFITLAGIVVSWLGSLVLYGFGELVDRAISIDNKLGIPHSPASQAVSSVPVSPAAPGPAPVTGPAAAGSSIFCPECGFEQDNTHTFCSRCGRRIR